jgi:hypothetical protein
MKLQIRKFDPSQMKPHRIILLVGRRGVGKSVLMRDLMERLSAKVDFGLAMTPTEDSAEVFRAHMPDAAVFSAAGPVRRGHARGCDAGGPASPGLAGVLEPRLEHRPTSPPPT